MFEDYQDDFADEDLSKPTKATTNDLNGINKIIEDNTDQRTKTVGDRILVWDTSRLTNAETGKAADDFEDRVLHDYPSIVIEDRIRFEAKLETLAGNFTKNLDLIVWSKSLNKKYRTSSEFVKLV